MRIGAVELLRRYDDDRVAVAVALIRGKLGYEAEFASDFIDNTILNAAKIRIELGLDGSSSTSDKA